MATGMASTLTDGLKLSGSVATDVSPNANEEPMNLR